jgi:hypothetical protein
MATRAEYLLQSEEDSYDPKLLYSQEILDTWASMGSITVNKKTALYNKGTLMRIDSTGPLKDRMVYVLETYQVGGPRKFIDWSTVTQDNVDGTYAAQDGVTLPYFMTLKSKWMSDFKESNSFIPFANEDVSVENGGVNISDDELEIILADIGFPFVTFQDVEYSKAEIERVCIKPALQRFFTFFPIVDEQPGTSYTNLAAGGEFLIEMPEGAYACVPYYTVPGGSSGMVGGRGTAFTFYGEQLMTGARGFGWGGMGKGVRYTGKQNPGFVGLDQRAAWLDKLAEQQGFLNYFRREKYKRKKIDGKLYAYGFSTIGGNLNFKWLKASNDWDDVPFELLETVARPMAKSAILLQFGMLRQLVKSDIAGQLDATVLTNQRKEYEDALKPILTSAGVYGSLAIGRGGG